MFLSRFSALDVAPHFRALLQESLGPFRSMVYVPTAAYCLDPRSSRPMGEQRRRARYDAKQKLSLLSQAFGASDATLLELDAATAVTADAVASKVVSADVLYVDGGNTFYLQRYLLQTGFWDTLETTQFFARGGLYVGASAGAIVAGRSVSTAYWKGWDDPLVAGEDFAWNEVTLPHCYNRHRCLPPRVTPAFSPKETLCGRALRPCSFFMHYQPQQHADLVRTRCGELDHPVRVVPDDTALVHLAQRGQRPYTWHSDGRVVEDDDAAAAGAAPSS